MALCTSCAGEKDLVTVSVLFYKYKSLKIHWLKKILNSQQTASTKSISK